MEEKNNKKIVKNFILFILLILLTLWVILKDQSIEEILAVFRNVNIIFVIAGMVAMSLYILLDAINLKRNLRALGQKTSIFKNIKYSLIGFFFSSITPAASGGQPMQIYYMYKDGIPVAKSTVTLVVNLITTQIATISLGIIAIIFNYQYMNNALAILFIVGIILNGSALSLLIIGIWSRRVTRWLINFTVKIMIFFKIKNVDKKQEKIRKELTKYHASSKYIRKRIDLIIIATLTTFVQFILYYCIAYCTYRALGLSQFNIFEIITMQAVVFATVSGLPSPGAVGVSEGAYIQIFSNAYPENMLKSATLMNRGINFYLFVLISGITVIVNEFKKKRPIEVKKI